MRAETPSRRTGRLRIRRGSSRVQMQDWDDGWKELLSTTDSSENLHLGIGLRSIADISGSAVVTIDDLRIEGLVKR